MEQMTNETLVDLIRNTPAPKKRMDYLSELYQNNYLYLRKLCKKYSAYEDIEDLMQEAFIGVRYAVEKYDPSREIPFINYASIYVEAEINSYIEKSGAGVRVPRYLRTLTVKYNKAKRDFILQYGREPSDQELEDLLSLDSSQLNAVKECASISSTTSLNDTVSKEDESITLMDTVADPADHYAEISDQIDAEIKKRTVWGEVDKLPGDEASVIKEYFMDGETLANIGQARGCAPWQVEKIKSHALNTLRKSKKIRAYESEYISAKAYIGTGILSFLYSGMSVTERVALDEINREIEGRAKKADKKIRKEKRRMKAI